MILGLNQTQNQIDIALVDSAKNVLLEAQLSEQNFSNELIQVLKKNNLSLSQIETLAYTEDFADVDTDFIKANSVIVDKLSIKAFSGDPAFEVEYPLLMVEDLPQITNIWMFTNATKYRQIASLKNSNVHDFFVALADLLQLDDLLGAANQGDDLVYDFTNFKIEILDNKLDYSLFLSQINKQIIKFQLPKDISKQVADELIKNNKEDIAVAALNRFYQIIIEYLIDLADELNIKQLVIEGELANNLEFKKIFSLGTKDLDYSVNWMEGDKSQKLARDIAALAYKLVI